MADDPAFLDFLSGGNDPMPQHLDNHELEAAAPPVVVSRVSGGGGGARGKQEEPPPEFTDATGADAIMGSTAQNGDGTLSDTSCEELDIEYARTSHMGSYGSLQSAPDLASDDEEEEGGAGASAAAPAPARDDPFIDGEGNVRFSDDEDAAGAALDGLVADAKEPTSPPAGRTNFFAPPPDRPPRPSGPRHMTPRERMECFGCRFTSRVDTKDPDQHIEGDKINVMLQMFGALYGRYTGEAAARAIHVFFRDEIYGPLIAKGYRIKMWRTWEIYEHFFEHTWDPRIILGEQVRNLRVLSSALHRTTFQKIEGGSGVKPNKDNIDRALRVDAALNRAMGMAPEKLLFYNPDFTVDFGRMGKNMNVMRNFALADQS